MLEGACGEAWWESCVWGGGGVLRGAVHVQGVWWGLVEVYGGVLQCCEENDILLPPSLPPV